MLQVAAFGHHNGMNAEDTLLPLHHEYFFAEKVDRSEIFQAAEIVLESHDQLRITDRLAEGSRTLSCTQPRNPRGRTVLSRLRPINTNRLWRSSVECQRFPGLASSSMCTLWK